MNSKLEVIPVDAMTRDEFLAERRKSIGGTDLAKILYGGAIEVYADKIGQPIPMEDSFRLQRGRDLEPYVAAVYARRHPTFKIQPGAIVRNPATYPLHSSVDRFVETNGSAIDRGLECKTVDFRLVPDFGEDGSDQVPKKYAVQVLVALIVTELDQFDLCATSLFEEREYPILQPNEETRKDLVMIAGDFMRRVELKDPPPPDETEAYAKFLSGAFKARKDFALEVTEGSDLATYTAIQELRRVRGELKKAEGLELLNANIIKAAMGEHTVLICGPDRFTWSPAKGNISYGKLVESLGLPQETIEKFRGEENRRFNCPRSWSKDE